MKSILFVKSSITGEESQSTRLAQAVIEKIKQSEGEVKVIERDLVTNSPPHFSSLHLKAFSSPEHELSDELRQLLAWSNDAIKELFETDFIVITAPMYNLAIPSNLKTWIDNINRAGKTFKYSEAGAEGLVKGKKIYIAISTGNIYSELPLKDFDHTESYLKAMLQFLGMTEIRVFRVEGTAISGIKETALEKVLASFSALAGVLTGNKLLKKVDMKFIRYFVAITIFILNQSKTYRPQEIVDFKNDLIQI